MNPLAITEYTLTTALGSGVQANWEKVQRGESGLTACHFPGAQALNTWVGEVGGLDEVELPATLRAFDCRNNRLAYSGLQQDNFAARIEQAIERYGANRIAVFIGTSTSGIQQTELAYEAIELSADDIATLPDWYCYEGTHNTYSVAEFVRQALGVQGICSAISTACSSSAKVFASASRALEAGLCDAAVVGGVDSLCLTTLHGFNALQLIANDVCRPSDPERAGLSIGEAAGFAFVERATGEHKGMQLLGFGESSDAHHMSSPHPQGDGALQAMQAALDGAALPASAIDYINLHGTGTRTNDLVEGIAVGRLFGNETPCSSTKGYTGHTLGAAGIVEAAFSLMSVEHGFRPSSVNTQSVDPEIQTHILTAAQNQKTSVVLSNSFGFGGSNCSLILGGGA
ncbi:MAG: beta-ketoacyl-[acyl-carrier-protein] synthase family protein [Halioglobus sp.]